MFRIVTLILAAGSSSRMGQPKQLLDWGESTLLDHAIQTALEVNTLEPMVVLGANYNRIEQKINQHSITILENKNWERGLGTSIAFGVNHILNSKLKTEGMLITLADQPFIDSDYLKLMIDNFVPNKKLIIATKYSDLKQGVPVLFDTIYFEELSKLDDDFGAKTIIEKHQAFVKTLVPPSKNADLDTPEEYKKQYNIKFKR